LENKLYKIKHVVFFLYLLFLQYVTQIYDYRKILAPHLI